MKVHTCIENPIFSQEINDIQLELIQKDIDNLGREMRDLKMVCDQLQDLYQQRDGLLSK